MSTATFFSIIIPTLNEETFLPLLLKDLARQNFPHFEVIVVDGHSDDKTIANTQTFDSKLNLKIINSPKRNVSFQRNLGAELATSEWCIFMDADDRIPSYFLEEFTTQIHKNPEVDIFTTLINATAYPMSDRALIQMANLIIFLYSKIQPVSLGALIGAKKSVCEITQFDQKIKFAEDAKFVQAAVKNGAHFCVFREPKYVTSLRRLKQEGTLKSLRLFAQMHLHEFAQGKIPGFHPTYPMEGGALYTDVVPEKISWYEQTATKLSVLSKLQKKKFWELIKKFEL